jgi:hypothetical protein
MGRYAFDNITNVD